MSFKIGDKVEVIHPGAPFFDPDGIVGNRGEIVGPRVNSNYKANLFAYSVKFLGGSVHSIHEAGLRKIDEGYDGNRIVSWDSCPWQPTRVTQ